MSTARKIYIRHAVQQARAFNRAFVRLLSGDLHDQRNAERARRRRDTWMDAARRAKANDPHRTLHAFWGDR